MGYHVKRKESRRATNMSRPDPLPVVPECEVPGYVSGDHDVHVVPKSLPHNSPRREQFAVLCGDCACSAIPLLGW
jgi:5-methylcytosine-specific restriction endonuclease McrA